MSIIIGLIFSELTPRRPFCHLIPSLNLPLDTIGLNFSLETFFTNYENATYCTLTNIQSKNLLPNTLI